MKNDNIKNKVIKKKATLISIIDNLKTTDTIDL